MPFSPGRHDPRELVDSVDNAVQQLSGYPDRLQQNALAAIRQLDGQLDGCSIQVTYYLDLTFQIFDNLFFGGSIQQRCRLTYTHEESQHTGCLGVTSGDAHGTVILIFTQSGVADCRSRFFAYMGTLLHEMVHAFMMVYELPHGSERVENAGRTGHGFCWQEIAFLVEVASNKLLQFPLDLGRYRSLMKELQTSPTDVDISRWGFGPGGGGRHDGGFGGGIGGYGGSYGGGNYAPQGGIYWGYHPQGRSGRRPGRRQRRGRKGGGRRRRGTWAKKAGDGDEDCKLEESRDEDSEGESGDEGSEGGESGDGAYTDSGSGSIAGSNESD